ncbi:glycoside hydrolase domain-containing protein [Paenibacillus nasutitermitis]|uniref:F5/8 type C domain-containing protein n=1 Tax=Paenibacillus nasutitermitis TaxID=1652958 RepID=A0A916YRB9_9BACL|nr:glycoside hydrolase domain-containing protein [Paenibacillus nasutitermitis]GGD56348.1 hypothetical protein GCM10010911_12590 [Paenibacillus nasutitermitis]
MKVSKKFLAVFVSICILATTLFLGQSTAFAAASHVWTESSYVNVFKNTLMPANAATSINLTVAKNEYEAAQILIRRDAAFTINSISFTNLTSGGNAIAASNLMYQFVEYIYLSGNSDSISLKAKKGAGDYPDPLSNETSMAVAANTTQSIWVRAYIPTTTVAGVYTGSVAVNTTAGVFTVPITLDVKNVTIPDPSNGSFSNAMWAQFFGPISWDLVGGESFADAFPYARRSADWWTVVGNLADLMKQNRSNVLPLNMDYLLMDGGSYLGPGGIFHFDWSAFDEVVQFFIDRGAVKQLQGLFMAQSANYSGRGMVQLIDGDAQGNSWRGYYPIEHWAAQAWVDQFIPALKAHLISKGWVDMLVLAILDEPGSAQLVADYKAITNRVKAAWNAAPGSYTLKLADAVVYNGPSQQLAGDMNVWIANNSLYDNDKSFFNARMAAGDEVWLYNCSEPRGSYLNRFIDQPVWEQRSTMWYAYREGLTGYLHYGYNVWVGNIYGGINPLLKGDAWITYPDNANKKFKSSIRYESLRDGIEDYELLKILEQTMPDVAKKLVDNIVNLGVNYTLDTKLMERIRANLVRAAAGLPIFDTNLAYTKTATASSSASGYAASRAVDNNSSTDWRSTAAGSQWIQVDLGAAQYQVDGVKLKWGNANYATSYNVQTSYNGISWKTVSSITGGNGGDDYIPLTPTYTDPITVKARYIRINFTASSGSTYNLFDLELGGSQLPKVNLAAGKPYTNSHAGTSPYLDEGNTEATDGVIAGTYIDHFSFGQYLQGGTHSPYQVVDLGSAQTVNQVKIHTYGAVEDNYAAEWVKVFTSTDNVNFTQKAWLDNLNAKERWYDITFPDTSARYIKVQYFKTHTPGQDLNWLFQDEIEVYGGGTGTNKAAGRPYTKSEAPSGIHPDTGNAESTNGVIAGEWPDELSYGFIIPSGTTKTVSITVDLGSDMSISLAQLRNYEYGIGEYGPDNVKVYTASNAAPSTFSIRGESSSPMGLWYEIPFSSVTARYVKFEVSKHNYGGSTNTDWLFLDELTVY